MSAVDEAGVNVDFYTTRQRDLAEPLAWDHVDTGVTSQYLKKEWRKAVCGELTPDCRTGECSGCGVCDFSRIQPRIFESCPAGESISAHRTGRRDGVYRRLEVVYAKRGPAKFFGHLEMVSIFTRAIRRAGIPIKFSEGFHPKPKISFEDPLPVGMESDHEILWITVPPDVGPDRVRRELNRQLPAGLSVSSCRPVTRKAKPRPPMKTTYIIAVKDGVFDEKRLKGFFEKDRWIIKRKNRKGGVRQIDLKKTVLEMERIDSARLRMSIVSLSGMTVRPVEVMVQVFHLSETQCQTATIVKEKVEAVYRRKTA